MRFYAHEIRKYKQFLKQWKEEVKGHGSPHAALHCLGFTFIEDIEKLKLYLTSINRTDIIEQIS